MKAFIFPGQGSQFPGMGKNIYDQYAESHPYFEEANEILGFNIQNIMFEGSKEDLKRTAVTQPAVFLYSYLSYVTMPDRPLPGAMAGHSLGELTALVSAEVLSFSDGLDLVKSRANAMQKACEAKKSTMAAIVGLEDQKVRSICSDINDDVVAANFNCPGQVVISGSESGVQLAMEKLKSEGAKRALPLAVGGAFHSAFMSPAEEELKEKIQSISFSIPSCPIYQNVDAKPHEIPQKIQENLISQLTSPVLWTQTMNHMLSDGIDDFIEFGGKVLSGFVKRVDRQIPTLQIM